MGEHDKQYEDSVNQGGTGASKTDGVSHDPAQPRKDVIPDSDKTFGEKNYPKHIFDDQWQPGAAPTNAAPTGVSLGVLTVKNEEHAARLTKELFAHTLISEAQLQEGGFHRSYLKFGKIETELSRARLTLITTDDKIADLIEFINHENPNEYDYPVPDLQFTPVS